MGKRDKRKKVQARGAGAAATEKQRSKAAAKAAKADKQASKMEASKGKKTAKQSDSTPEVDIELLLAEAARTDAASASTTVATACPSARSNFSLAVLGDELLVFGGEFFDGAENVCYNELYRWHVAKSEWKCVSGGAAVPAPRCSHQAVAYRDCMFVHGGEFATASQFYHHGDFWRFDAKASKWELLKPRGKCPPPRSGHRIVVWRNFLVLYGGFYETVRETKWYDDVWIYSIAENTWRLVTFPVHMSRPTARSGHAMGVYAAQDAVLVHGGYSKVKPKKGHFGDIGGAGTAKVHSDSWILHLKGVADGKDPTWEKVPRRATTPSVRSGAAMAVHKHRALLYGGVEDADGPKDALKSVFYDDLYAFDFNRMRWYRVDLKAGGGADGKTRRRRKPRAEGNGDDGDNADDGDSASDDDDDAAIDDEADDDGPEAAAAAAPAAPQTGWDLERLANVFAYVNEAGTLVVVSDDEDGEDGEDGEDDAIIPSEAGLPPRGSDGDEVKSLPPRGSDGDEVKGAAPGAAAAALPRPPAAAFAAADAKTPLPPPPPPAPPADGGVAAATAALRGLEMEKHPAAAAAPGVPLPRINAAMAVRGNVLFVYGGLLEIGDREVSLDDCWSLDLVRRDRWTPLLAGTMHEQQWRGEAPGAEDEGDDSDDSDDSDGGGGGGGGGIVAASDADGIGFGKKCSPEAAAALRRIAGESKGAREEVNLLKAEIVAQLQRTTFEDVSARHVPEVSDSLRDYFARTTGFWAAQVDCDGKSSKDIKRKAFAECEAAWGRIAVFHGRLAEVSRGMEEEAAGQGGRARKR